MYTKAVLYKGTYLAPGSKCLALHEDKKFKELDALIKRLGSEEDKRSCTSEIK